MDDAIKETLKGWGVELSVEQTARLELFSAEVLEKNFRFNLISDNDAGRLWSRHILDSLAAVPLLRRLVRSGSIVADAGAGAGFPGIPLAIALEGINFDFWDSNLKRQKFRTWVISRLTLQNAQTFHRRIGRSGHLETAKYDAVMERAMGKLANILPQCLNMVREGGIFLAWQSSRAAADHAPGPFVLSPKRTPCPPPEEIFAYGLPHERKDRFITVFRKKNFKH